MFLNVDSYYYYFCEEYYEKLMLYTNINIKDETNVFKYVIGYDYESVVSNSGKDLKMYIREVSASDKSLILFDKNSNLVRNGNYWIDERNYDSWRADKNYIKEFGGKLPNDYKSSQLYIYFPSYAVETYNPNKEVKYALTISTWLYGYEIVLGTYIISRINSLACPPKMLFGDEYVEYIPINIIDVYDFLYGSTWSDVREVLKNRAKINRNIPPCSLINISLHPIATSNDSIEIPNYITLDTYTGSQNSIQLDDGDRKEFLKFRIKYDQGLYGELILPGHQNEDLKNYLRYNYSFDINEESNIDVSCDYVIKDDTDIWVKNSFEKLEEPYKYRKISGILDGLTQENASQEYYWAWWSNYKGTINKPLIIRALATISIDDKPCMYLVSNDIHITQELFSEFIFDDEPINLDKIEMTINNIHIVNKTTNNIVTHEVNGDSKANIIQPIFFKARDVDNLIIHPAVTENICINLDSFKSKVNTFILQIEGCPFKEIGRTNSGVLFKIVGANLPKTQTSGLYYVLNENSELVSNGNYKYVI